MELIWLKTVERVMFEDNCCVELAVNVISECAAGPSLGSAIVWFTPIVPSSDIPPIRMRM